MNIEDDSDDEIVFKANTILEEIVPNDQLDDTLPYNPSPRQCVKCQELQYPQGDNPTVDNWADYDNYLTYDPPDQFDDTFYTINENWTDNTDVKTSYEGVNRATETHPDWAPTPVKVVGPEPELHELYFHEQALEISD